VMTTLIVRDLTAHADFHEVVSTVIAALAGGFLILLNSHFLNTPRGLKVNF
jgi:uncharacterized membrane protein YjjB (DUF3815 family)